MKSKLIFMLLTLFTSVQVVGQEVKDSLAPKFLWGITVAPGLSKINTEFIDNPDITFYDYKKSFQFSSVIGFFLQKKLNNNILLESGLLYSSIRGNESYNSKNGNKDTHTFVFFSKTTLKYINLPFLMGYTYKNLNISGGVQIGYNISAYNEFNSSVHFNVSSGAKSSALFEGESDIDVLKYSFDGVLKLQFNLGKGCLLGAKFYYQLTEEKNNFSRTKYFGTNLSVQYIINNKN